MNHTLFVVVGITWLVNLAQAVTDCQWKTLDCAIEAPKAGYHCFKAVTAEGENIKEDIECGLSIYHLSTKCYEAFKACKETGRNFGYQTCTGVYKINTYGQDFFQYPLYTCISSNSSGVESSFAYYCGDNNELIYVSYANDARCETGDNSVHTYEHGNSHFLYATCGGEGSTTCGYAAMGIIDCEVDLDTGAFSDLYSNWYTEILPIENCYNRGEEDFAYTCTDESRSVTRVNCETEEDEYTVYENGCDTFADTCNCQYVFACNHAPDLSAANELHGMVVLVVIIITASAL